MSNEEEKPKGPGILHFPRSVPFRLAHSRIRAAFKVYSAAEECGQTTSTHAQYHQLDLRGLKKLLALGRGARLSVSSLDDENDVIRMVRGRPKYTLFLICACV